jgi:predicted Zn-dependent peptidase
MLAELVQQPSFPEAELARERDVLLQEFTETEDDPVNIAFELFDRACFGLHAAAQPVIGTRRNIERFARADLVDYVRRQYTGANLVVGAAGEVAHEAIVRAAEAALGGLAPGTPNLVEPAAYAGDVRAKRHDGSSQTHVVLGFPLPPLAREDAAAAVAAALFGEGMSSPLMDQIRERRGLAYYAACSADVFDMCGQFVVEASIGPAKLDEYLRELMRLLAAHAEGVDPVDLERAHNQLAVRRLQGHERPLRRIEDAALDLFVHGRVRGRDERMAELAAVGADAVRSAFERLLASGASVAITGKLPRGAGERAREIVGRR